MMNQPATHAQFEARLRTMRILWAVFLVTIALYALLAFFALPSAGGGGPGPAGNSGLTLAMSVAALSAVFASFAVKGRFYRLAAERRDPAQAQTGFILAAVLCETAALFGLVALFVTRDQYAPLLFALGALGIALHFPRRDELAAAYGEGVNRQP